MEGRMFRQGDVLLVECEPPEKGTTLAVSRDKKGRVVLAHGEVTGHAHVVVGGMVTLREAKVAPRVRRGAPAVPKERFLHVVSDAEVVHDEHATVELPSAWYRVVRQQEYDPVAVRRVTD